MRVEWTGSLAFGLKTPELLKHCLRCFVRWLKSINVTAELNLMSTLTFAYVLQVILSSKYCCTTVSSLNLLIPCRPNGQISQFTWKPLERALSAQIGHSIQLHQEKLTNASRFWVCDEIPKWLTDTLKHVVQHRFSVTVVRWILQHLLLVRVALRPAHSPFIPKKWMWCFVWLSMA